MKGGGPQKGAPGRVQKILKKKNFRNAREQCNRNTQLWRSVIRTKSPRTHESVRNTQLNEYYRGAFRTQKGALRPKYVAKGVSVPGRMREMRPKYLTIEHQGPEPTRVLRPECEVNGVRMHQMDGIDPESPEENFRNIRECCARNTHLIRKRSGTHRKFDVNNHRNRKSLT